MEYKSKMEITCWEKECWICGNTRGYITSHHCLPKHLRPIKNFVCPVCEDCHKKLNSDDIKGIVSFAYKIECCMRDLTRMCKEMIENLKGRKE